MMGDNLYGGDAPKDYQKEFEVPYKPLLDAGVKFYASLGNHDDPNERFYKPFNMNGERYYTFKPANSSVRLLRARQQLHGRQAARVARQAAGGQRLGLEDLFLPPSRRTRRARRTGPTDQQRAQVEPVFLKYGVNVVFSGHEHFYERIKPQKGIAYFILGSSAKLRAGDIQKTNLTAKGWDQGYGFMLMEIVGDDLIFQMISDKGETIDTGSIHRVGKTEPTPGRSSQPVQQGPPPPKQPQSK